MENDAVKVQLVGPERFVDFRVSENVILRNDVVEVSQDLADDLLDLVYTDIRNNERPMFITYDPEKEAAEKQAKQARAERRSRKKA